MKLEFEYSDQAMELAEAAIAAKHPDKKIFIEIEDDPDLLWFETDIPSLNYLISGHYWGDKSGFALGKLYNFFGMESTGKTAMAAYLAGLIYSYGGNVAWNDVERSVVPEYMKRAYNLNMLDLKRVKWAEPDTSEEALDITEEFAKNKAVSVIVNDSVNAMSTEGDMDKGNSDNPKVAAIAAKCSMHFPRIIKSANDNKVSCIYINQLRDNIVTFGGIMKSIGKKTSGGNAMLFYPHCSIGFKKIKDFTQPIKYPDGSKADEWIGGLIELETGKNKLAVPHKVIQLLLIAGEGFSREADIIMLALRYGLMSLPKGSAWIKYNDVNFAQGLNASRKKLMAKPEICEEIWQKLKPLLEPGVNEETGEILNAVKELPDSLLEVKEEAQPAKKEKPTPHSKKGKKAA